MRLAYFGLPLGAVLLARDGHTIAYAGVLVDKGLRRLRGLAAGVLETTPNLASPKVVDRIRGTRPDLVVSWFWTKPIPASVLALAPAVGVHPSLLPRHRGPDPYFWAIDEGDAITGVTAHLLDETYDTGPILARRELEILPSWDAWNLARALDRPSLALLRDVVRRFAEGRPPAAEAQDDALATQAPSPGDDELAIGWSWPAGRVVRRVRAAAPFPGAWTEIGDAIVVLTRVRETDAVPRALEPGEAFVRADGLAVVRAGDRGVELLEGRAGDDEAPLDAAALARLVRSAQGRG